MRFDGGRRAVRMQSVAHALEGLLKRLRMSPEYYGRMRCRRHQFE